MIEYIYAFIGTCIEILADTALKQYVHTNNEIYYFIGLIVQLLIGHFFYLLLKTKNLGTANIIWHVFHFSMLFLIGIFVYEEKYTYKQILGFLFAIVALVLLHN